MADIEYTISGDASDLVGSLKDAADSASESMDKITESAQEAGAALDKDLGGGAENAKAQMHEVGEVLTGLRDRKRFFWPLVALGDQGVYIVAVEPRHRRKARDHGCGNRIDPFERSFKSLD